MYRPKIGKISCAQTFDTLAVTIGLQQPAIVTSKHGHVDVFSARTAVTDRIMQKHGLRDRFLVTQELSLAAPGRGCEFAVAFQSKPSMYSKRLNSAERARFFIRSLVLSFPQCWSCRRCGGVALPTFFLCGVSCFFFFILVVLCARGAIEFAH